MKLYVLDGHEPVAIDNDDEREGLLRWAQWYETADRYVMQTRLIDGSRISTVFLGIDHNHSDKGPPILFETAIFTGETRRCEWLKRDIHECDIKSRYATWGEAEEGHMHWIEQCVPPDLIAATNDMEKE
jgi:hypothetical protein